MCGFSLSLCEVLRFQYASSCSSKRPSVASDAPVTTIVFRSMAGARMLKCRITS